MTSLEKTLLANLLKQYQNETQIERPNNFNVSRETSGSNINSLEYFLSQGYTLHPPVQNTQQIQNTQQVSPNNDIIDGIIKGLQLTNVMTMQQPSQPQTTDDIIASIINPPLPDYGNEPNGGVVNGK